MNLALQLDKAAPILAGLKPPIVVAKIDADKYRKLGSKHDIEYVASFSLLFLTRNVFFIF